MTKNLEYLKRPHLMGALLVAGSMLGTACGPVAFGTDDEQSQAEVVVRVENSEAPVANGADGTTDTPSDDEGSADNDGASTADDPVTAAEEASEDATEAAAEASEGSTDTPGTGTATGEVASSITLVSADNEMNLQPDDIGWGLLYVDAATTAPEVGDTSATAGNKLLAIEFQIVPIVRDNFFEEAFRVQAEGEWYSPVIGFNRTATFGSVINSTLLFEIPESASMVTLEGGLPEALGPGRRAQYEIVLEAGSPPAVELPTDAEVEATASSITLTSASDEMNLQPDDDGYGLLAIDSVTTKTIHEEIYATTTTQLVVIDFQVTAVERDNFFEEAFRLQAGGEWYSPLVRFNTTITAGEIANGTVVFEVPRGIDTFVLEGGMPENVLSYDWDFTTRTATYEIVM